VTDRACINVWEGVPFHCRIRYNSGAKTGMGARMDFKKFHGICVETQFIVLKHYILHAMVKIHDCAFMEKGRKKEIAFQ